MIEVNLHGILREKFGRKHELDIDTPQEAIRALDANFENFRQFLYKNDKITYRIYVDKKPLIEEKEISISLKGKSSMHIFPKVKGRFEMIKGLFDGGLTGGGGVGDWAAGSGLGYGLDYVGDLINPGGDAWYESFGGFFGGLADLGSGLSYEYANYALLEGFKQELIEDPEPPSMGEGASPTLKSTTSYTFQRPMNNVQQGVPVPLGYGRLRVGSHVISSSMLNARTAAFDKVSHTEIDQDGNTVGAMHIDLFQN